MLSVWSGLVVVKETISPRPATTAVVIDPSAARVLIVLAPGMLADKVPVAGPEGRGMRVKWAPKSLLMLSLMVHSTPSMPCTSTDEFCAGQIKRRSSYPPMLLSWLRHSTDTRNGQDYAEEYAVSDEVCDAHQKLSATVIESLGACIERMVNCQSPCRD